MSKRILFFAAIPLSLLLMLGLLYSYFMQDIQRIKEQEKNIYTRQVLISDLNKKITALRFQLYQVPLLLDKKEELDVAVNRMFGLYREIENVLRLLVRGGHYTMRQRSYSYRAASHADASRKMLHEAAQVYAQIQALKEMTVSTRKREMVSLLRSYPELGRLVKTSDTVFLHFSEEIYRLFYASQNELARFKKEFESKNHLYSIMMLMIGVLLLLSFFVGLYLVVHALRQRLYTDTLTGLPSRESLEERVFGEDALLFLVDIDDFSDINSLFGSETGDQILQCIATQLQDFDQVDIYRVAGDVFGLYYTRGEKETQKIIEMIHALSNHLQKRNLCSVELSVTIGVARGEHCLHDAFIALDIAAAKNESYHLFYHEDEFREQIAFNRYWYNVIKKALDEDGVIPFFQPIVDRFGTVVKYEALMRLRSIDQEGSVVYLPPVYIDVAHKTKQYAILSQRMIEKVFAYISEKKEAAFSLNIAYQDINTLFSRDFLKRMILEYDVAGRLTFEILESNFEDDYELLKRFMREFRRYGVEFAIDDFGRGYSNAERVISLNPDYIKIDSELIRHMLHDKKSHKMIENIVSYAKEFHIITVAEHVDSVALFEACRKLGIDYFQGYLFAEPAMTLQQRLKWLPSDV